VTTAELVEATTATLASAGLESAEAEARWLVEDTLGLEPADLLRRRDPVEPGHAARVAELAARRAAGEPLQYLLGWAPFGPLKLAVGPGVFVPRPETEVLADLAAGRLRRAGPGAIAVDLCTGSGAVACYLATQVRGSRVLATEIDRGALAWARRNAGPAGVELRAGDLDGPLPRNLRGEVAVLSANVPYIPSGAIAALPADVRLHEPRAALDGGPDGLDVLRRVAGLAPGWLAPDGWILCEIGEEQGAAAAALFDRAGFTQVRVHPDLTGRDRIVEGQWRPATTWTPR
jgi:release factor glutamine methyltransferase